MKGFAPGVFIPEAPGDDEVLGRLEEVEDDRPRFTALGFCLSAARDIRLNN